METSLSVVFCFTIIVRKVKFINSSFESFDIDEKKINFHQKILSDLKLDITFSDDRRIEILVVCYSCKTMDLGLGKVV